MTTPFAAAQTLAGVAFSARRLPTKARPARPGRTQEGHTRQREGEVFADGDLDDPHVRGEDKDLFGKGEEVRREASAPTKQLASRGQRERQAESCSHQPARHSGPTGGFFFLLSPARRSLASSCATRAGASVGRLRLQAQPSRSPGIASAAVSHEVSAAPGEDLALQAARTPPSLGRLSDAGRCQGSSPFCFLFFSSPSERPASAPTSADSAREWNSPAATWRMRERPEMGSGWRATRLTAPRPSCPQEPSP